MATAQSHMPPSGYRVSLFVAFAGMIVTFLLGVYVGLHPAWIPVKTSTGEDYSQPVRMNPATMPTAREPDTRTAATTQP